MLSIPGSPALTPARLRRRLVTLSAANPGIADLYAEHVHFIDVAAPLDVARMRTLERLLVYGPRASRKAISGLLLLVVPRLGTISPWSSKATDIAHLCARMMIIDHGHLLYDGGLAAMRERGGDDGTLEDMMRQFYERTSRELLEELEVEMMPAGLA